MAKDKKDVGKDKKDQPKETFMEFISSMAGILVTGLFIVTFNFQAFEIPSSSMVQTLLIGDHLFVDRTSFAPKTSWMPLIPYREVQRDDIVVFLSVTEPGVHIVKRIIGIPGDRIQLRDGVVYRNGQKLDEPYVIRNHFGAAYVPYRDDFPQVSPEDSGIATPEWRLTIGQHINDQKELVVPADSYFGMGDNRDASFDSRYWGFIPKDQLIGRPMFIYWSFVTDEKQVTKTSIGERLSWVTHVVFHFLTETRWRRTLRLVR